VIIHGNKLELHYYLLEDSHSINAFIRNECEKELLSIFKEVIASLDLKIKIESEAFKEGGLREIWKFIGENGIQLTLVIAILNTILSRVPVENTELIKIQIENLKIDNELKRLELQKIKKEVSSEEEISPDVIDRTMKILDNDFKIARYKSNFYKKLNADQKVTKFSTTKLDNQSKPIDQEITVDRSQFKNFILHSNELPPNIDENASIDIISPVLKKGSFKWKGFYKGEIINFEMKDQIFNELVLSKSIEFINGTTIKCVLHQKRKLGDTGLEKIYKNKVMTVFDVISSEHDIHTEQGKKYKRLQDQKNNQLKFDL
jgi:hypothetical protein